MRQDNPGQDPSASESIALDLWLEFLGRARWDDEPGFRRLCERHPHLAAELAELRARGTEDPTASPATAVAEKGFQERMRSLENPLPRSARFAREVEIARGGMGVVFKVRDLELDRSLALKRMIVGPAAHHPVAASRFLEEAQITAQLDHPGIVPVHDVGMDEDGHIYFAMKLVRGRDLRTIFGLLREGREGWNQTRALGVLLKVCEAMAYAHSKGVIHRDLKPANVMVGHFGEVYVMDWGLARALGREDIHDLRLQPRTESVSVQTRRRSEREETPDSPLVTMDGAVVGTPSYMPPEQARGEVQRLSPRADVYSVGAMIYHLLTGQAPFVPSGARVSNHTALARLLDGPPVAVHTLNPQAPVELVAICDKAMARDPDRRYRDTLELGDDLRAFVEDRVVHAYQTGALAELTKWVKRNRALASSAASAALLLVAGLSVSLVFRAAAVHNEVRARDSAEEARKSEQRARASELLAQQEKERAEKDRAELLGLSALPALEDLEEEANHLWPAHPENVERYRLWLGRADALVAQLAPHEAKLAELRARARPWTADEASEFRAAHPQAKQLESLRRQLAYLRMRRAVRESAAADPTPEEAGVDFASLPADPDTLNSLAWPLIDPERKEFGDEAKGLVLARRALELAHDDLERGKILDTLAWALLALGRFEEARSAEQRAVAADAEYASSLARLEQSIAGELDPLHVAQAAEQLAALAMVVDALADKLSMHTEWVFASDEDRWWHYQLDKLVKGIRAFTDEATGVDSSGISAEHGWGMRRRLAFALTLRDGFGADGEYARAWAEALPRIRAAYPGLALTPQLGLLPLGPDPLTGLWEFAHLQTGTPAVRGPDGRLRVDEATGLVFVLLPGGTFPMGAQKSDPDGPNYDARAEANEGPVNAVSLSAFFLSKFEMTVGQWLRFTGIDPGSGSAEGARDATLLAPVGHVSFETCVETLGRLGLELPTEAQWEYGARGGTSTAWWTGAEPRSLQGAANLADAFARQHGGEGLDWSFEDALDDGAVGRAPIGSYAANSLGLHDVAGNVWEWCRDWYGEYGLPVHAGDGERQVARTTAFARVLRGGGYASPADFARSAKRWSLPSGAHDKVGLRPARSVAP